MALNEDADARLVATLAASRLDHFDFSSFSFGISGKVLMIKEARPVPPGRDRRVAVGKCCTERCHLRQAAR